MANACAQRRVTAPHRKHPNVEPALRVKTRHMVNERRRSHVLCSALLSLNLYVIGNYHILLAGMSPRRHNDLPSCHAPVALSRRMLRVIVQTLSIPPNSPAKRGAKPCAALTVLFFPLVSSRGRRDETPGSNS
jgi:hypothetical protein